MKRTLAALATTAAAFLLPAAAQASIIPTLTSVVDNGNGTFTWTYGGTIASDQGLQPGDRLIIYDFAGYVPGSIFVPTPQPAGFLTSPTTELLSNPEGPLTFAATGNDDSAAIPNLVFTYQGPETINLDCSAACTEVELTGFGAISTFGGLGIDGFSGDATRNASATGSVPGTQTLNFGSVSVPTAAGAVPEPATWAMMLIGFGALGAAMRRQKNTSMQARFRFA